MQRCTGTYILKIGPPPRVEISANVIWRKKCGQGNAKKFEIKKERKGHARKLRLKGGI
jgi:hypothetical protein